MSLIICSKCAYRITGEHTHCPECHRQLDGTEERTDEKHPDQEPPSSGALKCPHCGSEDIHPAKGLEGFKEYFTVGTFFLMCLAGMWLIPFLIMIPVTLYYLYIKSCPHCQNCDRRLHRLLGHLSDRN
jgi:RNA polymerase subunit RPABC4/transcription elongation factor Spt4